MAAVTNEEEVEVSIGEKDFSSVVDKVPERADPASRIVGFAGPHTVGPIEESTKCEIDKLSSLGNTFEPNCPEHSCLTTKVSRIKLTKALLYTVFHTGGLTETKNINGVGDVVPLVSSYDTVVNHHYRENALNLSKYDVEHPMHLLPV